MGGGAGPWGIEMLIYISETHAPRTATRVSFYSIYVYQEKGGRQERGKIYLPQIPPQGDLCAKHNGSVCSPTTGSALVNILLVFLRHLF